MTEPFKVYLITGGVGTSGEQVVQTVLAQFPGNNVKLDIKSHVHSREKLTDIAAEAAEDEENNGVLVVHTLVNGTLRAALQEMLDTANIPSVDLMGDLIRHFSTALGREPSGEPGLYRKLYRSHFERVEAIDYALQHDDGIDPQGWTQAQAVLIGPSRTGKTPISMYMAVLGWKIANYPLVPGLKIPETLKDIAPARIVGLTIDPVRLVTHRKIRQKRLGTLAAATDYTDLQKVFQEIEEAEIFYRLRGYRQVDVTDKPIEACADEILHLIPDRD